MENEDNKNICPNCEGELEFIGLRLPESLAIGLAEKAFPIIWKDNKEFFKMMSKKELAKEMLTTGAKAMIAEINDMTDNEIKRRKNL